ncbi:hypothetical protein J6590_046278 [Homalodisca vitripennis]|nr:hypothetical protein J6590_046278 [Homalodisca vitripennis]
MSGSGLPQQWSIAYCTRLCGDRMLRITPERSDEMTLVQSEATCTSLVLYKQRKDESLTLKTDFQLTNTSTIRLAQEHHEDFRLGLSRFRRGLLTQEMYQQLTQACGALSGSTFHSLATRGNIMEKNKNQNQPTLETVPEAVSNLPLPAEVAPEATSHIPSPGNTTQEVVMPKSLPSPQQSALGTQEVPLHTEAPIHGKALSEEGSTSAEESKALQDIEDQLLNSPSTPMSTGTLDDATEQLGNLRMKRPNLTTAQRRKALKAKLLEKGEAFDPSKWRRGKKKKKKNPEQQEVSTPGPTAGTKAGVGSAKRPRGTLVTPPSAEGPAKKARRETQKPEAHDPEASGSTPKATYREVAAIKMAIALEGYPEAKLCAEQGEAIEDAIMEEIQPLEDGSVPSFAGTYLEKGVLVASCINEHTKRWLEEVIQRIKPLGDDISLRVGLRKDILRSTRVFFRAHPKLLKKTPEKVLEMFNKQNPNLNVNEWKILPSKPDPKGLPQGCEGFQL